MLDMPEVIFNFVLIHFLPKVRCRYTYSKLDNYSHNFKADINDEKDALRLFMRTVKQYGVTSSDLSKEEEAVQRILEALNQDKNS
jgi:hypothetical protein